MQVAPSGGQICNLCKWCHLVAKFATYASGVMFLLNLIQVTKSISGSVVPLAMFDPMDFLLICGKMVKKQVIIRPPTPGSVTWVLVGTGSG